MKLDFTEKEKKMLLEIINDFREVNSNMEKLKSQSIEINQKLESYKKRICEIKDNEISIMKELNEKYGNVSLQDIADTIYGK